MVASGIAELVAFAGGLEQGWAAVVAGLTLEWSSGQVEGQVNRVKLLKRQMFGSAKRDLLRKRVLLAAEGGSTGTRERGEYGRGAGRASRNVC